MSCSRSSQGLTFWATFCVSWTGGYSENSVICDVVIIHVDIKSLRRMSFSTGLERQVPQQKYQEYGKEAGSGRASRLSYWDKVKTKAGTRDEGACGV